MAWFRLLIQIASLAVGFLSWKRKLSEAKSKAEETKKQKEAADADKEVDSLSDADVHDRLRRDFTRD